MLTRRGKAYSMPMLICNRFHERLANIGKIATFTGVPFFDRRQTVQTNRWNNSMQTWKQRWTTYRRRIS